MWRTGLPNKQNPLQILRADTRKLRGPQMGTTGFSMGPTCRKPSGEHGRMLLVSGLAFSLETRRAPAGPQQDPLWSRALCQPPHNDSWEGEDSGRNAIKKRTPLLWLQRRGKSALPRCPRAAFRGSPGQSSLGVLELKLISS